MQAIHVLEPAIVTIHASGGRAMMEDAKAAAGEHTKVVGVTVLTSLDDDDLGQIGVGGKAHDQVLRLADLAHQAGLDGIVCSGHEVAAVHRQWKDGFFVVPGLRPAEATPALLGDQKRTVTPRAARDAGASVLVVGRPIAKAEDPVAAARAIEATL
jgi:orotidine-5'-phosphate decarboxylase